MKLILTIKSVRPIWIGRRLLDVSTLPLIAIVRIKAIFCDIRITFRFHFSHSRAYVWISLQISCRWSLFFRNSVLYCFQPLWEHNHKWKIYVRTNINIKANRNTLNAGGENQTKLTDWELGVNKSTQNAIIYMYICGSIFKNRFVFTSQTNKMRVARLRSNSNNNNNDG